jgi:hypothetical protein
MATCLVIASVMDNPSHLIGAGGFVGTAAASMLARGKLSKKVIPKSLD